MWHIYSLLIIIGLTAQTIFSELKQYDYYWNYKDLKDNIYVTDPDFLGVTLDALLLPLKDQHYIFESKKFIKLARNLGTTYFRMGGTAADAVHFVPHTNTTINNSGSNDIILDTVLWDKVNAFVHAVGCWKFIFGLNALIRNGSKWDPTNALQLLRYSKSRSYKFDLELGNEPGEFVDAFGKYVEPEQLAEDFATLKELIKGAQNDSISPYYSDVLIYGPDLDRINDTDQPYLKRFLNHLGTLGPSGQDVINRLAWHHYYVNGPKAKPEQFINIDILNSLLPKIHSVAKVVAESPLPNLKIWLGEGSSAYNSGAPNISDRFIAGFMFLDKIGLCAANGVRAFIRQAFYYGQYAMIGRDLIPNPDYWTAILFKRLVGPRVLPIKSLLLNPDVIDKRRFNEVGGNLYDVILEQSSRDPLPPTLRLYGHCARIDNVTGCDRPGAVVMYALNLGSDPARVAFAPPHPLGDLIHAYTLTAPRSGSEKNTSDWNGTVPEWLLSREIALNGKILRVRSEGQLPPMKPVIGQAEKDGILIVDLPSWSYGFYVFPKATVAQCL